MPPPTAGGQRYANYYDGKKCFFQKTSIIGRQLANNSGCCQRLSFKFCRRAIQGRFLESADSKIAPVNKYVINMHYWLTRFGGVEGYAGFADADFRLRL